MDVCPSCQQPLTRIHDHTGKPTRETVCLACVQQAQAPLTALAQPPELPQEAVTDVPKRKRDKGQPQAAG